MGRPGHAKRVREPAKKISGPTPRRSRTVPEQCPSEFGAASGVAHNRGTIFCRFCVVARKPRYAFRISFYTVLLASNKVSSECVHAAKNVGIRGISVSQSEPGRPKIELGRPSSNGKTRKRRTKSSDFFYGGANDSSWNEKVRCGGFVGARASRRPRALIG